MTIIVFYVHLQATAGRLYSYLQTHKNEKCHYCKKENNIFSLYNFIYIISPFCKLFNKTIYFDWNITSNISKFIILAMLKLLIVQLWKIQIWFPQMSIIGTNPN